MVVVLLCQRAVVMEILILMGEVDALSDGAAVGVPLPLTLSLIAMNYDRLDVRRTEIVEIIFGCVHIRSDVAGRGTELLLELVNYVCRDIALISRCHALGR